MVVVYIHQKKHQHLQMVPESGVEVSYKWMGVAQFNEDGKIHNFADWFDVSSIPSQIAGTYQR